MKKFSIGSKNPKAKQININLKPKHIKFGAFVFVVALLFHMFVYSPYLKTDYKIKCLDGEVVLIEDYMSSICGYPLPPRLLKEEIYERLNFAYNEQFLNYQINLSNYN